MKIKIGRAAGANWWCILFPPLCFVNVEEATSLPVDGKAGVSVDSVKKELDGNKADSDGPGHTQAAKITEEPGAAKGTKAINRSNDI